MTGVGRRGRPSTDPVPASTHTDSCIVGRSWAGAPLAFGLEAPLELRGGAETSGSFADRLPFDWLEGLADLIAEENEAGSGDGRRWFGLPPLVLVGRDRVLAEHVASIVALRAGVPLVAIDLAEETAGFCSATVRGGPEVTMPSRLVLAMAASRCANPIVLVKGAETSNGASLTSLCSMMDRRTASRWTEEALDGTIDLSHVSWLTSVESVASLPLPLSRLMRVVPLQPPEDERGRELLMLGILAEASARFGIPPTGCVETWTAMEGRCERFRHPDWALIRKEVFDRLRA